jgi:hypothetical protein
MHYFFYSNADKKCCYILSLRDDVRYEIWIGLITKRKRSENEKCNHGMAAPSFYAWTGGSMSCRIIPHAVNPPEVNRSSSTTSSYLFHWYNKFSPQTHERMSEYDSKWHLYLANQTARSVLSEDRSSPLLRVDTKTQHLRFGWLPHCYSHRGVGIESTQ